MKTRKIITYNVNGIRSALTKGWMDWLRTVNPDIVLLQEIKAEPGQLDLPVFDNDGYSNFWHPAQKKGYSGVAIFSKEAPDHIEVGSGNAEVDTEGRIIRADFGDVSVMSVYVPSGSSGDHRQDYKMEWLEWFSAYIETLLKERKHLIIGGDINICHRPIDIHNPVSNAKSSGFLPEERAWMDGFLNSGFIDSFRHFNPEPHQYTWWSFRANARAKNLGWRIDYLMASEALRKQLKRCVILPEAKHSDHCPVLLEVEW
ncbi:MAG: exodeoxyribonuclease III [Sphingobacteriales bacterium]|nr:exodeoxyribonuclease III [Sphingobacteriales bacterium]